MPGATDPRDELRELIAALPEANRRTEDALKADPSGRVGDAYRRFAEADEAAVAIPRKIRALYATLSRD